MSPITTARVTVRRVLVRRPWIYWLLVAAITTGVATSLLAQADRLDAERDTWGDMTTVLVATRPLAPGEELAAERRSVPIAMAPPGYVDNADGLIVRQRVGVGEVIVDVDVVALSGAQALTPNNWLAVPIRESPASGAALGDRVQVASDGVVVTAEALVVGHHDDATLVATPADDAPVVAAASAAGGVTLLLVP